MPPCFLSDYCPVLQQFVYQSHGNGFLEILHTEFRYDRLAVAVNRICRLVQYRRHHICRHSAACAGHHAFLHRGQTGGGKGFQAIPRHVVSPPFSLFYIPNKHSISQGIGTRENSPDENSRPVHGINVQRRKLVVYLHVHVGILHLYGIIE